MNSQTIKIVAGVILISILFAIPSSVNSFYLRVMGEVLIFAMLAMSINIMLGYTGLATLGQAAIFGIGTYTVGYMTTKLGQPNSVSLDVPESWVVALLGRNGMGKTTLIRSVVGTAPPEVHDGSIKYKGQELISNPPHAIASLGRSLTVPSVTRSETGHSLCG